MTPADRLLIPPRTTQLIAHVLPQFHPIPENDEWWGAGFTEWTNVVKARPLFKGHYQPHLPADLGFYDLRLPDTRERQAELAREAGITGFCYYHYWFGGRRLLERPVNEVLASGKPDFPFCLCWANEPWSRNWDGQHKHVLMPQSYSPEDDVMHIRWLLDAFCDDRYIKISGRPLFLIYRPSDLPDIRRTTDLWRREAAQRGLPDLYLCGVRAFAGDFCAPADLGLDASVEFKPNGTDCGPWLTSSDPLDIGYRLHRVWDYEDMVRYSLEERLPDYPFFRSVCPSWDNSARRKCGGMIFRNASPRSYQHWLKEVLFREQLRSQPESIVFINAWNEWAEGNHLEPCQKWGRSYLDSTRAALDAAKLRAQTVSLSEGDIVAADCKQGVKCIVDSCTHTESSVVLSGWCVWGGSNKPPALLVFAEEIAAGSFQLIRSVASNGMSRPDVADHLNAPDATYSGWMANIPRTRLPGRGPLRLLAFEPADGLFALAARI